MPAYGHTYPTLPLVAELVHRGEQIIYYSSPAFRQAIEQVGAGKALRRDGITAHKLRSTVDNIFANPSYRQASNRLGKSFGTLDGYIHAADEIQAFKRMQGI